MTPEREQPRRDGEPSGTELTLALTGAQAEELARRLPELNAELERLGHPPVDLLDISDLPRRPEEER